MIYLRLASRNNDFFTKQFMDQIFKETQMGLSGNSSMSSEFRPKLNVREDDNEFILEMAIPGVSKEEVSLKVEKDLLKVIVKRENSEVEGNYHRQEFSVSDFERSFKLSSKINKEGIKAKVESGVLLVNLPLIIEEKQVVKQIQIH